MDFEEIKERYKLLPLWGRFLIAGFIGLLPGGYVYWDEGDALQTQLDEATASEADARQKFEKSRKEKANLPKMEEEMAFTEEQLVKAKQKLPDDYRIEEVLQKAATIAKEVGVKLVGFDPGEEVKHFDNYKYVEMPIKTEVVGRFSQVAAFFDRVVHLENSIFVRNIDMKRAEKKGATATETAATPEKSEFQIARESRQNLRLSATFDLAIFRSMSDEEASTAGKEGEGGGQPVKGNLPADLPVEGAPVEGAPPLEKPADQARAGGGTEDVTTF